MTKVFIDGYPVLVERGSTVLQACESVGVEIPRFCYHERLSVAGNCRMCLVEIEKTPKPVSSCTMPTMDGMKVFTDTPLVRKAREAVLEFLLINHPLECAVCDQGGECDLQDQAFIFAADRSRFYDTKRGVEDKECGPLIKTHMTRCIHCTRCVRFSTEIAGVEDLGTTGRGREVEIGTYVSKTIDSELSGNVIDLCPVGALTSKPYAMISRPWELRSTDSVDISDGLGSNIRVDSRGNKILRVLPRFSEEINEEWITDKARFSFDGLTLQRLTQPFVKKGSSFEESTWEEAFSHIQTNLENMDGHSIHGVVGKTTDSETAYTLKAFLQSLGSPSCSFHGSPESMDNTSRDNYALNASIMGIEEADLCLLVGIDTRFETSLLNARLRKCTLRGNFSVASIGPAFNATYPVEQLGSSLKTLAEIAEGKNPFCSQLWQARKPVIICGTSVLEGGNHSAVEGLLATIREHVPSLTTMEDKVNTHTGLAHTDANIVGFMDLGLKPNLPTKDTLTSGSAYILAGTDSDYHRELAKALSQRSDQQGSKPFIVFLGHTPGNCHEIADVILPGLAFTEKQFSVTNTEGRHQLGQRVIKGPKLAREDWKVLSALSQFLGFNTPLPLSNYGEVQKGIKQLVPSDEGHLDQPLCQNVSKGFYPETAIYVKPMSRKIQDFYLTDEISKTSKVMAECSVTFSKKSNFI